MKSGIYKIENKVNNRMYIGSAKNLNERKINHFSMLRNSCHTSIILQRAYNKAKDKTIFEFVILEECEENILIERENYYLNELCKSQDYINNLNKEFLKLSYNILPFASKGFSGKHRPETILKFKTNHPLRKNILIYKDNMFLTKVMSSKDANSVTNIKKGVVLNACKTKRYITRSGYIFCFEEDKNDLELKLSNLKLSVHNKGKRYTKEEKLTFFVLNVTQVKVTDLTTNSICNFFSQKDASDFYNLQPCTINRCLKSGKPYRKKLLFEYHNDIV